MRAFAFAVAASLAVLAARRAHAFSGFYVSGADTKLSARASQVVLMREGTRTVLSMQSDYEGPPESFAMVVPVPVILQKDNVKTLPREIFARVDRLDAPRLVEYWEQDPCMPPPATKPVPRATAAGAPPEGGARADGASDLGVTIEAQFTVGEYEIVMLGAKDSAGLEAWLRREGYKLPADSEPYLRPYVTKGSKFFVAKVDASKLKMAGGKATLSPLRFHYDAAELQLPIRLGLVSSAGTQDLVVHVLARGRRYEAANYPNALIPTNLDVAEKAKEQLPAFYAALFDRTVATTPNAVVTEYAWDAGSCDPCPASPLSDADLVTLGADVLPSVSSENDEIGRELLKALGADAGSKATPRAAPSSRPVPRRRYYGLRSSFVLTRLHARYTRDAVTEDLTLKEAPPLAGGREIRSGAERRLETTTTLSSAGAGTNTFQGRYAVRHPWAGSVTCANPVRDVWGGPPNGLDNGGPRPATDLAYAAREDVSLASFLRSDVASLDVKAAGATPSGVGTFAPVSVGRDAGGREPEAKRSGCAGCTAAPSSPSPASGGAWLVAGALVAVASRRRRVRSPGQPVTFASAK